MLSLKIRRIIMIAFVAVFFVIAPLLLLYATGYRYDFSRGRVIQTGTLMIESKDVRGATLYIDDESKSKGLKTETFVDNILPGEYTVRIEKDGFYPWEQKITIQSKLTTFIKGVVLFRRSTPELVAPGAFSDFFPSPDGSDLAFVSDGAVQLYSATSNKTTKLYELSPGETVHDIVWAASGKRLLLVKEHAAYTIIYLLAEPELTDLGSITPLAFDTVTWDSRSDTLLYAATDNSLYKIDLIGKSIQELVTLDGRTESLGSAFYAENQDLYFVAQTSSGTKLQKYNALLNKVLTISEILPSQEYVFVGGNAQYITLIDRSKGKILIFNTNPLSEEALKQARSYEFGGTQAYWQSGSLLLYYTDFEVKLFDFKTNTGTLINRYGEPIQKALLHPNSTNAFILFGNRIDIVEIGTQPVSKNIYTIASFDAIHDLSILSDAAMLFFPGSIGKQQGLYRIPLK